MPLLSIIVPVYKTEEFLERCIKAVLKTEYDNIELILVDDGSPDTCPKICDQYAQADEHVRVLHRKNSGVYAARNAGIEAAAGEYIAFCDSDDYVPENAYSLLMKKAIETDADVVRGLVRQTDENTGINAVKKRTDSVLRSATSAHYANVYKRELLMKHNIRFLPFTLGEDLSFMIQVLNHAQNIQSVDEVTYIYLIRPITAKNRSAIQIKDFRHYYDDFRWREWVVNYMNRSEKLLRRYKEQMGGGLCPAIDKNWLMFERKQREKCYASLKNIVQNIDWSVQKVNANGYLWMDEKRFLQMEEVQYTKYLKKRFYIIEPVKRLFVR